MASNLDPSKLTRAAVRNSPWLVIAVMVHVVLIAVMSVVYIHHVKKKDVAQPTTVAIAKPAEEKVDEEIKPPEVEDRKAIPKNEEAEIVEYERDVFIPHSEPQPDEDLTQERGNPESLDNLPASGATGGTAIGTGGKGHHGAGVSPFSSRKLGSGGLGPKGRGGGATQGTEKAVLEGLRWLCRHQNPDGSWGGTSCKERCIPEQPCIKPDVQTYDHYDEGLTGLALLAFLGAGYSNESKQDIVDTVRGKRHRIGEVVKNGLQWLVKRQKGDGSFSKDRPFMYNEVLATLALTEAYGLTGNRYWKDPAQKGLEFLINAQKPAPSGEGLWGWRYSPRSEVELKTGDNEAEYKKNLYDADTSVTAWAVMALKSGELSGLPIPKKAFEGAMAFTKFASASNGLVGYLDSKGAGLKVSGPNDQYNYHVGAMSALGLCTRIFSEKNPDDPWLDLAAKQIVSDLPAVTKDNLTIDYYYWYYGTLALNQLDGPDSPRKTGRYWGPWNKAMQDAVLGTQEKAERSCGRGGWLIGDRWCYAGGPIYATAVNVLTLEVYYRYENAFGGSKRK